MNYDFKTLNDKEFEALCSDVIGLLLGVRIERFKAGKDGGVDGRFFAPAGGEVILQCKHWANTSVRELVAKLGKNELPKVIKLNPDRYLLAVSNKLSKTDKKSIVKAFSAVNLKESDIFGNEDINDILAKFPDAERRHYKLWLHSAAILSNIMGAAIRGRSEFSIEEFVRKSSRYVVTSNHQKAIEKIENNGVLIISGEPGVGKTTLAEQICLYYLAQGFDFLQIADSIIEAESQMDPNTRQIFYFDDFLGRNYLDAITGRQGAHIAQFIRRIASNKNKRFVLTTRSNILNQGKVLVDTLDSPVSAKREYELKVSDLNEIERAKILYSHIWSSNLPLSIIDEIYKNKRYRSIIRHQNYNPRLIGFITDAVGLSDMQAGNYWAFVSKSLDNPKDVWEHAFISQHDDFCRAIVILVALHRFRISESKLISAYARYLAYPDHFSFQGRRDFYTNSRILTGTFLNRNISETMDVSYDLFNPSVGDYILSRYEKDKVTIERAIVSLESIIALMGLEGLEKSSKISSEDTVKICSSCVESAVENSSTDVGVEYVSTAISMIEKRANIDKIVNHNVISLVATKIMGSTDEAISENQILVIKLALDRRLISDQQVARLFVQNGADLPDEPCFSMATDLIRNMEESEINSEAWEKLRYGVVSLISSDIDSFIDMNEAFSEAGYGNYPRAKSYVQDMIYDKLSDLGFLQADNETEDILDSIDLRDSYDSYFYNSRDSNDSYSPKINVQQAPSDADIDDIFERD